MECCEPRSEDESDAGSLVDFVCSDNEELLEEEAAPDRPVELLQSAVVTGGVRRSTRRRREPPRQQEERVAPPRLRLRPRVLALELQHLVEQQRIGREIHKGEILQEGLDAEGEEHPPTDVSQLTNSKYPLPATREHPPSHETGDRG